MSHVTRSCKVYACAALIDDLGGRSISLDVLGDLNWLAVIVAAIAYFVLGAIWYAPPVLGNAWMRAGGVEMPEGERPGSGYTWCRWSEPC